jgi:hypothetical protein
MKSKSRIGLVLAVIIIIIVISIIWSMQRNTQITSETRIAMDSSVLNMYYAEHQVRSNVVFLSHMIFDYENPRDAFIFLDGYARSLENPVLVKTVKTQYKNSLDDNFNEYLSEEINASIDEIPGFILRLNYLYKERNKPLDENDWITFNESLRTLLDDIYYDKDQLTLFKLASEPKGISTQYREEDIIRLIDNINEQKQKIENLIYKLENNVK